MPRSALHKARIYLLQSLTKETLSTTLCGSKTSSRFMQIDPIPLNEPSFELLVKTVDDIIGTSSMETDADKMILIDPVIRAVCRECTSRLKIHRDVSFKCKALEAFGRVDVLRAGDAEKAVVMECKLEMFDQCVAHLAVAVEMAS